MKRILGSVVIMLTIMGCAGMQTVSKYNYVQPEQEDVNGKCFQVRVLPPVLDLDSSNTSNTSNTIFKNKKDDLNERLNALGQRATVSGALPIHEFNPYLDMRPQNTSDLYYSNFAT